MSTAADLVTMQEKRVARLREDKARGISILEAKLREAQKHRQDAAVELLTSQLANSTAMYDHFLSLAEADLADARARLREGQAAGRKKATDAAAQAEDRAKRLARHAFVAAGGGPEAFETAWPRLWNGILEDKAKAGLAEERSGLRL